MALSQSALSELLEVFRAGEGVDLIREAVRVALQDLIEAEATEVIGAGRYERVETRRAERNGARPRVLTTKAGDVRLAIPKLRSGSFFPEILAPRRRIDQALHAVVMEAYVHGVSTRAVDDLVAALGGTGISRARSPASAPASMRPSPRSGPAPWATPPSRTCTWTRPTCTCARPPAGRILGVDVGDSEDETFWRAFLTGLRDRGLGGVRLVISDQHAGLVKALGRCFAGAAHQRCRVHFARNLLAPIPKTHKDMAAAVFRTVFAQPDAAAVRAAWEEVRDQLAGAFPKVGPLMDEARTEVLAFTAYPRPHWVKIWSNNPIERLNKEIKRRARVVGIFPNDAAVIRLVGAVLADAHDEWQVTDRRYLSESSMAALNRTSDTDTTAAITSGK